MVFKSIRRNHTDIFFRFEDLLMNPEPVLKDMFRFILAEENLENTIIEKRIKDVVGNGQN